MSGLRWGRLLRALWGRRLNARWCALISQAAPADWTTWRHPARNTRQTGIETSRDRTLQQLDPPGEGQHIVFEVHISIFRQNPRSKDPENPPKSPGDRPVALHCHTPSQY